MMDIQGKRVVITGASRGIGRGLAEAFAGAGARLALVARSASELDALAGRLGGSAYPADLGRSDERARLTGRLLADGPVDVLVNNAGVSHVGHVLSRTAEQARQVLELNLLAPIELCLAVLPGMVERRQGRIVNVSSMAAAAVPPGLAFYGASKAGLSQFTAGLRQDIRTPGVGFTLVEIGSVDTEMDAQSRHYGPIKAMTQQSGGFDVVMKVDDVAAAIVDAVRHDRDAVRLPWTMAWASVLTQLPRSAMAWAFRRVDPEGT
jgi:short-subunit dehydrogenase